MPKAARSLSGRKSEPAPDPAPAPADSCTGAEELANALTHGLGLLLAVAGTIIAVLAASATGSPMRIITVSIFCTTLIGLYLASTAFHLTSCPVKKPRWRLIDHIMIYALIAGSYTPVALLGLGGAWGWFLVVTIWALAAGGTAMKLLASRKLFHLDWLDTGIYLAMGWLGLVAVVPIVTTFSLAELAWLIVGGVFYSLGCIFFLWESLRFNHAIWHGFVMAGSACHFFLILLYMVPVEA